MRNAWPSCTHMSCVSLSQACAAFPGHRLWSFLGQGQLRSESELWVDTSNRGGTFDRGCLTSGPHQEMTTLRCDLTFLPCPQEPRDWLGVNTPNQKEGELSLSESCPTGWEGEGEAAVTHAVGTLAVFLLVSTCCSWKMCLAGEACWGQQHLA